MQDLNLTTLYDDVLSGRYTLAEAICHIGFSTDFAPFSALLIDAPDLEDVIAMASRGVRPARQLSEAEAFNRSEEYALLIQRYEACYHWTQWHGARVAAEIGMAAAFANDNAFVAAYFAFQLAGALAHDVTLLRSPAKWLKSVRRRILLCLFALCEWKNTAMEGQAWLRVGIGLGDANRLLESARCARRAISLSQNGDLAFSARAHNNYGYSLLRYAQHIALHLMKQDISSHDLVSNELLSVTARDESEPPRWLEEQSFEQCIASISDSIARLDQLEATAPEARGSATSVKQYYGPWTSSLQAHVEQTLREAIRALDSARDTHKILNNDYDVRQTQANLARAAGALADLLKMGFFTP